MYILLSVARGIQSFVRGRNPKIVIMSEELLPKESFTGHEQPVAGERIAIHAELLSTKCIRKEALYHI